MLNLHNMQLSVGINQQISRSSKECTMRHGIYSLYSWNIYWCLFDVQHLKQSTTWILCKIIPAAATTKFYGHKYLMEWNCYRPVFSHYSKVIWAPLRLKSPAMWLLVQLLVELSLRLGGDDPVDDTFQWVNARKTYSSALAMELRLSCTNWPIWSK